jgi:DHA1 family tetracycline resistance protein-like MFS transporter
VLLISQVGTLIGFLILGFASSLWMLFLSRIIDGLSGANIATAQAAMSDSTTEKTRTQGLGLIGAAFGIGFVIGPIIAFVSLAASGNNYHVAALIAAGFSLISIILTWLLLPETLPKERRGQGQKKPALSLGAMLQAMRHPLVGMLLVLIFAQQIAFGGFEQLLSLFTMTTLGLNASGNAIIFVFVGIIVVIVQGGLIGPWSRKYGDRRLIVLGLGALALGLILTALTPSVPPPWYSQDGMQAELSASGDFRTHENPTTQSVSIALPDDSNTGWIGLAWILVAMIPASIGGGLLQPSINSLITKRVGLLEIGGMLGISAALLSAANAIAPLLGGALFQAIGPAAPFMIGGLMLVILMFVARRSLQPGAEEQLPAGLARSGGGH